MVNRTINKVNAKFETLQQESRKYELLLSDFRIKDVRLALGTKIFQQFIINYINGLKCEVVSQA